MNLGITEGLQWPVSCPKGPLRWVVLLLGLGHSWGGQWALGLLFSPDPWDPLWGSHRACGLLCAEGTLPVLNPGEGPSLPEWEERKQHPVALLGGSAVSGGARVPRIASVPHEAVCSAYVSPSGRRRAGGVHATPRCC